MITLNGCMLANSTRYIDFNKLEEPQIAAIVDDETHPIRVGVSLSMGPSETNIYYRLIAEYIEQFTRRPVVLIQRKSNAEITALLAKGGIDIAFFSSGEYISYNGREEIELLVMEECNGSPVYESYIIVSRNSAVNSLKDLSGKSFAFSDPLSYSGYFTVVNLLQQMDTTPERFFNRFFYTYSQDKSLRAVANRVVDGAAINSLTYEYIKKTNPDLADGVRIIDTSGRAGAGPVVIRKNITSGEKKLWRILFLNMHRSPEAYLAMQGLMINRFVEPKAELLNDVAETISKMRNGR
ncbi:MAG: phosphonate transporter, periplasmic phosphonate-binding protein [Pelosinus sp.]|nr:phosphonate transporter, periplasmic phosphonate-binding protein [Pelosinus sp.]